MVVDDKSGLIVDSENFDGLVEGVARLCDAELRRALAEGGRERLKEFGLPQMIRKTEAVYEKLCVTTQESGVRIQESE